MKGFWVIIHKKQCTKISFVQADNATVQLLQKRKWKRENMQKIIEIHETFIKNKFYVLWSMTDRPAVKWIVYWMLIVTGYLQQKFLLCILNCSRINHIFSIASWTDGPINNKVASSLKKQTTLLELDERQVVVDSRIFFATIRCLELDVGDF